MHFADTRLISFSFLCPLLIMAGQMKTEVRLRQLKVWSLKNHPQPCWAWQADASLHAEVTLNVAARFFFFFLFCCTVCGQCQGELFVMDASKWRMTPARPLTEAKKPHFLANQERQKFWIHLLLKHAVTWVLSSFTHELSFSFVTVQWLQNWPKNGFSSKVIQYRNK